LRLAPIRTVFVVDATGVTENAVPPFIAVDSAAAPEIVLKLYMRLDVGAVVG
jgi:hypothetical protein